MRAVRGRLVAVLAVAGLLFWAEAARAAISCTIAAVGVSFGTYNVFATSPLDSTGSITYTCVSIKNSDRVTIDISRGSGSSFNPRQMFRSGEALGYNLYMDSARTQIWGDGTSGTSHPNFKPLPLDTLIIYGRITAGQDASAGNYSDTVIATINF